MPNHVANRLIARGPDAALKKLRAQAAGTDSHGPLDFAGFVRPEPHELRAYAKSAVGTPGGWYQWNMQHWSTKWNAYDAVLLVRSVRSDMALQYNFTTANSPPLLVFEAMTAAYPELTFELRFEDEAGPGGTLLASGGIWYSTDDYSAATSHTEATNPRRLSTCACLLTGGEHVPFPDCRTDE